MDVYWKTMDSAQEGHTSEPGADATLASEGTTDTSAGVNDDEPSSEERASKAPSMDPANLHYEGDICVFIDPETKYQFQWDTASQQWKPRGQQTSGDTEGQPKLPGGIVRQKIKKQHNRFQRLLWEYVS